MEILRHVVAGKPHEVDVGDSLILTYESHREAHRYVSSALESESGIAFIRGPRGAGKTTIVNELAASLRRDSCVAVFDGADSLSQPDASGLLAQFGVEVVADADDRLLQILSNYMTQQAREGAAPVLIIDNADRLESRALSLINWLADLDVRGQWSVRFVLTGAEHVGDLLANYSMRHFKRRKPTIFDLNPVSKREAAIFLRAKFIAAGGKNVEQALSLDVCDDLHELAQGWPGKLSDLAVQAAKHSDENPDELSKSPRVILSKDGETVAEYALTGTTTIIGRDQSADIVIDDAFVSKEHAMLKIDEGGVLLLDLKSTNGTRVNSVETTHSLLRNNDIITIGPCELRVENLPMVSDEMARKVRRADTLTLENPDDIRRSRAKRLIRLINKGTDRSDSGQVSDSPRSDMHQSQAR